MKPTGPMEIDMDTTKLRIRVAELCGWTHIAKPPSDPNSLWPDELLWGLIKGAMIPPDGKLMRDCGAEGMKMAVVPDYCNDLNACAQFEKLIIGTPQEDNYYCTLLDDEEDATDAVGCSWHRAISATAEQRCRAFVATMEASSVPNGNEAR